jgi:hypothetical protein
LFYGESLAEGQIAPVLGLGQRKDFTISSMKKVRCEKMAWTPSTLSSAHTTSSCRYDSRMVEIIASDKLLLLLGPGQSLQRADHRLQSLHSHTD